MSAICKLKSDKVNDNGLVYSNNFIHGTELLFQYLSVFDQILINDFSWILSSVIYLY